MKNEKPKGQHYKMNEADFKKLTNALVGYLLNHKFKLLTTPKKERLKDILLHVNYGDPSNNYVLGVRSGAYKPLNPILIENNDYNSVIYKIKEREN